jgi:phosphoglycolate phosphatase
VKPPVVLFDLDGTVLTFEGAPPGPGRSALERAMLELYALEHATEGLRVAGGTDRALARALLARAGCFDDEGAIDGLLGVYVKHLEAILRTRRYHPVGDVAGTVTTLRAAGARVGAATGNLRAGAKLKLASAGLASVFDLAWGAYGDDAEPRSEIVRLAADRCGATSGAEVVVVGDTEHDARAARAIGARIVGVATSPRARAELIEAGVEAIVDACGDDLVQAVLAF